MTDFADQDTINLAAAIFVDALGTVNRKQLEENLRNVRTNCDALRALESALIRAFNIDRQTEIRRGRLND